MNKKENILKWVVLAIAIAIDIFIIVNSFINGEKSAAQSNSVAQGTADIINTIKPETITPSNFPSFAFFIRKAIGHFGLFGASGVFTSWSLYLFTKDTKVGYFLYEISFSLIAGFSFAVLSEFAQTLTDGRVGAWKDVGIDMGGYFIGVLLVIFILLIRKSHIFKRVKK